MRYSAKEARETALGKVSVEKILDEIFLGIRKASEEGYTYINIHLLPSIGERTAYPSVVNLTKPMLRELNHSPEPIVEELEKLGYKVELQEINVHKYLYITW